MEALVHKHAQVATEAVSNHGWTKVMLATMKFENANRDELKIPIDYIRIDPRNYSNAKPWLFNNVMVKYSLRQVIKRGQENWRIKDAIAKLLEPSNLLNTFDADASKPFAAAIIQEMNRKYQQGLQ